MTTTTLQHLAVSTHSQNSKLPCGHSDLCVCMQYSLRLDNYLEQCQLAECLIASSINALPDAIMPFLDGYVIAIAPQAGVEYVQLSPSLAKYDALSMSITSACELWVCTSYMQPCCKSGGKRAQNWQQECSSTHYSWCRLMVT